MHLSNSRIHVLLKHTKHSPGQIKYSHKAQYSEPKEIDIVSVIDLSYNRMKIENNFRR